MKTEFIHNVVDVLPLSNYRIEVTFDDGLKKVIDVQPFIKGGVSSLLRDISYFNKVIVESGYITWDNGFDFCPVFLRNL